MINGHNLGQLIGLAFDYTAAETEQETKIIEHQAAILAVETTTFRAWLDLIEHIQTVNNCREHKDPLTWADALQFFSKAQFRLSRKLQDH